MQRFLLEITVILGLLLGQQAFAGADLEVNTATISAVKSSMQTRHALLVNYYNNGAIGLTKDGLIAIKDANAVALKDRQSLNSLVSAENSDRNTLYKEIASANGHAEWEAEIRATFAQRWIQKAQAGWWFQDAGGWSKR